MKCFIEEDLIKIIAKSFTVLVKALDVNELNSVVKTQRAILFFWGGT